MEFYSQVKAMLPGVISGKTLDELEEELAAMQKMGFHFVKGIKLPSVVPVSNLEALNTFEVRHDDVYAVTYQRSGTHWILEIISFVLNDGRKDFDRTFMTSNLESTHVHDPSKLENTTPGYKLFEAVESPNRCMGCHLPVILLPPHVIRKAKVVYVARNPKDMLVSYFNLIKDFLPPTFRDFGVFLWLFYAEEIGFGTWFDHVLGYWRVKDHPNVLFLKYEDLHKDLRGSIRKVAEHVGKDLSDDVIECIAEHVTFGGMKKTYGELKDSYGETKALHMTNLFGGDTTYLRKGKVGDWKNAFTVSQNELFDKIYALRMEGTNFEFDFEL